MKLTVVGCSGSFPSTESPCSSYLVEADDYRLLLDMGNGALGELQRHCGLYDLDAILLSHLHSDHCIDMCGYFVARYYRHDGMAPPIPVYGPHGTEKHLAAAHGDLPDAKCMSEVFDFRTLTPGRLRIGPFDVTVDQVNHPVEAYGVRLEHDGRTLTYSGDTGLCDQLARLAEHTGLLLCEASFTHGKENIPDLHLTGREAGEYATRARAQRLVLTHIPPWTDPKTALADARTTYDGPTELARPGAVYHL
jgi:ribonuclease BN (tRNA processing enzyme)